MKADWWWALPNGHQTGRQIPVADEANEQRKHRDITDAILAELLDFVAECEEHEAFLDRMYLAQP